MFSNVLRPWPALIGEDTLIAATETAWTPVVALIPGHSRVNSSMTPSTLRRPVEEGSWTKSRLQSGFGALGAAGIGEPLRHFLALWRTYSRISVPAQA